ncbi:MAG: alpha/beta fold hydrolase [Solirubrobacteraceae bacterium]
MDAAGVAAADIVGFSMGARIAIELCLAHPERVRTLTLIAGRPAGRSRRRMRLLGRVAAAADRDNGHGMGCLDSKRLDQTMTHGISKILWLCMLGLHRGLARQCSIASRVLRATSGPSIGWRKKCWKSRATGCRGPAHVVGRPPAIRCQGSACAGLLRDTDPVNCRNHWVRPVGFDSNFESVFVASAHAGAVNGSVGWPPVRITRRRP